MTLNEAIDILEDNGYILEEDFTMGVGAPCGLDQGIPHGGDCIGVAPPRIGGCARRTPPPPPGHPPFAPIIMAHRPYYWLNQVKKRKKKKKHKK